MRFHEHGSPAEVLRVDDVPMPEPSAGEVRVRLTHRTINPADLSMVRGTYGRSRDLPAVGGNEGMGVIDTLGDGVEGLAVGQRVVKLGEAPTWKEAVVLGAHEVFPVPDALSDEDAAQLFVNPLTAWLLHEGLGLWRGDVLVQTAGASAVARIAAQLAQRWGARTVAIVRRDDHRQRLDALGATVVVADENTRETRALLREAVGASGARAVFDPVAGDAGALALSALAEGGTHVVYGGLSRQPLAVPVPALIYRDIEVRGVWRTRWAAKADRETVRTTLAALAVLLAEGAFDLPVHATHDLSEV
ncbi:MAG: zinc-dependent alcohol dehydrogenase family protein, partial [Bacteroidota bacterium]